MNSFVAFCTAVLGVVFSPAQVVLWSVVVDGKEPCDFEGEERVIARQIFGDVERIPPEVRVVCVFMLLKGARMGGTWGLALVLLWRAVTGDCSMLAPGERGFCIFVAPDLKTARQGIRYALGAAESAPSVARFVETQNADGFVIRRPDGRRVSIECLAASRGGSSVRGRTYLAAVMDEASFFRDASSGVVNDAEIYNALVTRVVPGGMLAVSSTAWMESGLLWKSVEENHGHPRTAIAAIAPTLLMRNDARMRAVVEAERSRDPENAAREFDCVPLKGAGSNYFDWSAIDAAQVAAPLVLATKPPMRGFAALDAAFRRDAFGGAVVHVYGDKIRTAELFEKVPSGEPLKPSAVIGDFAAVAKRHQVTLVHADSFYIESVREHLSGNGCSLSELPSGNAGKALMFGKVRTALYEGQLELSDMHLELAAQLKSITEIPLSGGLTRIVAPRRPGNHADVASAWVAAMWAAIENRGSSTDVEFARGFERGTAGYGYDVDPNTLADQDAAADLEDELEDIARYSRW